MADGRTALMVDWGGVLTTDLFNSFSGFCESEGLLLEQVRTVFRNDEVARGLLVDFECGRLEEEPFCTGLGAALGVHPEGLVDRLFAGSGPDHAMIAAVRAARAAGIRTGLLSNSWGSSRYPHDLLEELFDGITLSGEVGMRKPTPEIYALGAQRMGADPATLVYVDDLSFNLPPAEELGMATVLHTDAAQTIARLEELLGVGLSEDRAAGSSRRS